MTGWIRTLIDDLARPDSQPNDWYAWATNQTGHVLLGIIPTWGAVLAGLPAGLAVTTLVALYAGKEVGDLRRGAQLSDALTDLAFVSSGAGIALAQLAGDGWGFALLVVGITAGLLAGIRRRIVNRTAKNRQ